MTVAAFRMDVDARNRWIATHLDKSTPPAPLPVPTVPARLLRADDPAPAGAHALVKLAESHGWTVLVVYARGTTPPYTSSGLERASMAKLADSVSVRCWRFPGQRAVALWERPVGADKWSPSGWVWTDPGLARSVGVSAVKEWIKGEG